MGEEHPRAGRQRAHRGRERGRGRGGYACGLRGAQRANAKDAGLLVERARVERGMYDVMRAFRDSVMTIGQRSAPRCIGLADARDIEHVITDETRKALEGFEARLAALLPPKETA